MGFQTTSPIACEHAVPFGRQCPACVLALWQSMPHGPAPRRLRDEIARDERLERRADSQADTSDWSLGDEHPDLGRVA